MAQYIFTPQKDIDSYELAQILPYLVASFKEQVSYEILRSRKISAEVNPFIERLDENLRRHFSEASGR